MRAELDTFVGKVYVSEGQQVKKGQLLMELDVKDAAAQLAETHGKLLQAQDDLRVARAGGKPDQAAKVAGDLTNAQKKRERLQKNHEALVHLMAQQAATQEELAANELELSNEQAEVARLTAVKQEFDRSPGLESDRAALQVQQPKGQVAALRAPRCGQTPASPLSASQLPLAR